MEDIIEIEQITNSLQKNKHFLEKESIRIFTSILKMPEYKTVLRLYLTDNKNNETNPEIISEIIKENISDINNLRYQLRKTNWIRFLDNEVLFAIKSRKYSIGAYNPTIKNYMELVALETVDCYNLYWQKEINKILEDKYSGYNLFEDHIIENTFTDKNSYKSHLQYNLDTNVWDNFVCNLLTNFFPGFSYDNKHSKGKMHRITKEINNKWLLGIEFPKKFINRTKKDYYTLDFPESFNLVAIEKSVDSKRKKSKTISFGILCNPFCFFSPMPPNRFMMSIRMGKKDTASYSKDIAKIDLLPDNKIQITYDKDFATRSKRYIIYYISILQYTSTCYLKYIEKTIADLQ